MKRGWSCEKKIDLGLDLLEGHGRVYSKFNSVVSTLSLSLSLARSLARGLTNSDNTSCRANAKRHPSGHIFPWHRAPLSELLQSRVGRESDSRIGALSEHLFKV